MGISFTNPSVLPVGLKQVKAFLRIDTDDENSVIQDFINVATHHAEDYTGRAFINRTVTWTLDSFPAFANPLFVPRAPLSSVTSIQYKDTNGDTQTLASSKYIASTDHTPGRITPLNDDTWPFTEDEVDAVTVTYVAGYDTDGATVPMPIKQAVMMLAGHFYEHRELVVVGTITSVLPITVERLLSPYRIVEVA